MADVFDVKARSQVMARVRSTDTSPELALRRALHRAGFRYRLHATGLPGKPDLSLPRYGAIVFVHGCFWHQHKDCPRSARPKSNQAYWDRKLSRNAARDEANAAALEAAGLRVAIVWECALTRHHLESTTAKLAQWLRSTEPRIEIGDVR